MLFKFRDFTIDTNLFELRRDGELIPVEPQVFNLLVYLAQHCDRIISRQELLEQLWAGKVISKTTLNSCVKAARRALGDSGQAQNSIATFNRRGYRFVAPLLAEERPAGGGAVDPGQGIRYPSALYENRPSLVVLPFANSQGGDAVAWTTEMLSQDISIYLARIPGFLVVSRNSASHYRGGDFSLPQIRQALGVDYVIDGSMWESGDSFRVAVQLLEAATGAVLWADRTEIPLHKLSHFKEEVVREIANRIEPELNRAEFQALKHREPLDLGAWDQYRRAHATLSLKGWSEESFRESADLLRQAISLDPELAFAHAYLALILAIGHLIGLVDDPGWQEEAVIAAENAIALDNQDSDVLGYAGCAFADMGAFHRGIGLMRRAVELDPSNAQAYSALGSALLRIGKPEGIELMRHGIRISPIDTRLAAWGAMLARGLLSMGLVSEAIEASEQACHNDDKIFLPRLVLAIAHCKAGNTQAASGALADARRIRPQLSLSDVERFANPDEIKELVDLVWEGEPVPG